MTDEMILELKILGLSDNEIWKFWGECLDVAEDSCLPVFDVVDRMFLEFKNRKLMGGL